jgi:hypothetical protein
MRLRPALKSIAACAHGIWAPAAFAHEKGGWAAIHWHLSDFAGIAVVAGLTAAALWVAFREARGMKT